ncbi:MAG: hypothetical protein WA746_04345 [Isosphaeraceae bacterium]
MLVSEVNGKNIIHGGPDLSDLQGPATSKKDHGGMRGALMALNQVIQQVGEQEAISYMKLSITLMAFEYWDHPDGDPEYNRLARAILDAWNQVDLEPVLTAMRELQAYQSRS